MRGKPREAGLGGAPTEGQSPDILAWRDRRALWPPIKRAKKAGGCLPVPVLRAILGDTATAE